MKTRAKEFWSCCISLLLISASFASKNSVTMFPEDGATNVNPDTRLQLTFQDQPALGNSGQIRVYGAADDRLVDPLDLSIPPGPTAPTPSPSAIYTPVPYPYVPGHFTNANTKPGTPSGAALPTSDKYQLTIIGGFTDGFHFYPVIVRGNTAIINLHNNLLEYGKTYYVQIDQGVPTLKNGSFTGIAGKAWKFTTRKLLSGIDPVGWGEIGGDASNVHYWEYGSTDLDGKAVDARRRHPASRQLTMEKDAEIIANYKKSDYVLGGWSPEMAPLILSQPESVTVKAGESAIFHIEVAAIPEGSCQWFKEGRPIAGATDSTLVIKNAAPKDSGIYFVAVKNSSGSAESNRAKLKVVPGSR